MTVENVVTCFYLAYFKSRGGQPGFFISSGGLIAGTPHLTDRPSPGLLSGADVLSAPLRAFARRPSEMPSATRVIDTYS